MSTMAFGQLKNWGIGEAARWKVEGRSFTNLLITSTLLQTMKGYYDYSPAPSDTATPKG
ncbi:MAG: hypothetical protein OEX02_07175 [Cyclobacteriaceae bacterium]|nr:hypothetical protein [Cyclobacteriaceae bacterium]